MRKIKIVADSSANVTTSEVTEFAFAPMKIITAEKEFVDDTALDVDGMVEFFDTYKNKSKTSCPNSTDWLEAFGDADDIICITITSGLSGSYNSACAAKDIYESENKGKRVCVIDSLSAGPELQLAIEKAEELIAKGEAYEDICKAVKKYFQKTGLLFMLESLNNFAANGRVSPAVAKITGFLGIRVVGKASDKGELEPLNKCRGEARSLDMILNHLKNMGHSKGKIRIAHCKNSGAANTLKNKILGAFPKLDIAITECRGLCSYYAEKGGMLVAFEKM
ncbi:MAG: DegV family protein [Ruminococcus sp.]|nr:DegV family protein [Ruminococcus sp.]